MQHLFGSEFGGEARSSMAKLGASDSQETQYLCWYCRNINFESTGYMYANRVTPEVSRIELQHLVDYSKRPGNICRCCTEIVKAFEQRLQNHETLPSFPEIVQHGNASVTWKLHRIASEPTWSLGSDSHEHRHTDLWRFKVVLNSELFSSNPISMFIQKSSNESVANRWDEESGTREVHHLGRTRPLVVDPRLLRQWKADCTTRHGPGCQKPYVKVYSHSTRLQVGTSSRRRLAPTLLRDGGRGPSVIAPADDQSFEKTLRRTSNPTLIPVRKSLLAQQLKGALKGSPSSEKSTRPLRYIDVTRRCLVELAETPSYVALSYVWGQSELPQLSELTMEAFSCEGALSDDILPKTIADAVKATKMLDEMYLWVDCLCIIQSHHAEKQNFIRSMHEIYARSSVTIIAAYGTDANAGLPGLTQGSRTLLPDRFWIRNVPLVTSLDPSPAKPTWWLGDTPWLSRAWTFQEKAVSPRCIIFTQEQVYWECRRSLWCEDRVEEAAGGPSLYEKTYTCGLSYKDPFGHFEGSNEENFMGEYCLMVTEYTDRFLTYEQDIISAFEGILGMFKVAEGRNFLWALPRSCLAQSLSWNFRSEPKRRRVRTSIAMEDSEMLQCSFPSWSWVGWIGPISPSMADPWKAELVHFYFVDNNFELQSVRDEEADLSRPRPQNIIADTAPLSASPKLAYATEAEDLVRSLHWRPSPWNVAHESPINKSDIPEHILASPDLPSFLFCHTSIATIQEGRFHCTDYVVIDGDRDEVVAMPVRWNNGVAYREPDRFERIPLWEWMELRPRRWNLVVLG
jgi:Heterokaryon incompatibility protein (HET)